MNDGRPLAIGGMRLSTQPDRDDERAIAVLQAAFDAGVTLLDTADAYGLDDRDIGHNERLIARALSTWRGDRSAITVATKGGITRPEGRWVPDGRAKHLAAACERSCRALNVPRIDLYQLHVPDPRTPLSTSIRALAKLKRDGLITAIGLCNVTVGQIEEARRLADLDSIQVELSVWHDGGILSGVAEYCIAHHLRLLAHRPLGGRQSRARTSADAALNAVASRHGATPFEVALAWLRDLAGVIVPIPGVTRIETVQSVARAEAIRLTGEDRETLDARFPAGRRLRRGAAPSARSALRRDAEVVLIMGVPGAGKSTLAEGLVAGGYQRLNRDEAGGTLRDVVRALERTLAEGTPQVVLDNTYVTRKSRAEVIRAAAAHGVPVRCVYVATSVDQAQVNAAARLVARYGRLPADAELEALRKIDVAAFPPSVQFRYQRELEPPDPSEGFSRIDRVEFERRLDRTHVNRAVFVWSDDGTLIEQEADLLRARHAEGWRLIALSWQPQIAAGTRTAEEIEALFASVRERTALEFEIAFCPHAAGPPRCWCRKPLPGLGVLFIHRYRLDPSQCLYIGNGAQDPGFARKLGFSFRNAAG